MSLKCVFGNVAVLSPNNVGRWSGVDLDGASVSYSDSQMQDSYEVRAFENGEGVYVVKDPLRPDPVSYEMDYENLTVQIESEEEGSNADMHYDYFRKHALRVDQNGKIICPLSDPLHVQKALCEERGGEYDHLLDIQQLADVLHNSDEIGKRTEGSMYYLVTSGIDDGLSFLDVMKKVTDASFIPVHKRPGLNDLDMFHWHEIRTLPTFMQGSVRGVFNHLMGDLIDDVPIEQVSLLPFPHEAEEEITTALRELTQVADWMERRPPMSGSNFIPNYSTSEVDVYRGEGFEVAVFSDFAGKYLYAWPTPPERDYTPPQRGM